MDTLLHVLPSSGDCRATARIVNRRTVIPNRDGSGEFVPPLNMKELDEGEQSSIMARGGKPYTVYIIEIAQVTPFRKSWSVERRYREFVSFASKLERNISKTKTTSRILDIKLPPKQLFMVDDIFLQKRQVGLDQWIQQIPKLFNDDKKLENVHDAVRTFLLPAALRLLRHKRVQSDTASISSMSSDPTPPSSPSSPTSPSSSLPHHRSNSSVPAVGNVMGGSSSGGGGGGGPNADIPELVRALFLCICR